MQFTRIRIKNFKSIRDMEIRDIENALILVGKNNTGKTSVLDAVRYKSREQELLTKYIDLAPREDFSDILDAIDAFVYFDSRKKIPE